MYDMTRSRSLVKRSVLDNAANNVIKIGPSTGWKALACVKLRKLFPNQTCTIIHAMDLNVHWVCASFLLPAVYQYMRYQVRKHGEKDSPSVQSVNSKPEKQIDAIPMKYTNSAIIARRDLEYGRWIWGTVAARPNIYITYSTTTVFDTTKNASLHRWQVLGESKGWAGWLPRQQDASPASKYIECHIWGGSYMESKWVSRGRSGI